MKSHKYFMGFQPIIKWTGSKRIQSKEIIKYFPEYIDTYYEPFCGGCSVMYEFLKSDNHFANKVICSDINGDLIDLWNTIKKDAEGLFKEYSRMWNEMNKLPSAEHKKKYFEIMRDEFNQNRSPYIFFFLMRTCTNGTPRYNRFGQFNNTFHLSRSGMNPKRLERFIYDWRDTIDNENIIFKKCDYKEMLYEVVSGDFVYLDPPCELTRSTGKYFGRIDYMELFSYLRMFNSQDVNWILSWDGNENTPDYVMVPDDCYCNRVNISSQNVGYRLTKQKLGNDNVYESLYIN